MSGGKPFLDTNILIYAFVKSDPRCHQSLVLLGGGGVVSVQVMNEFVTASRKKLHFDWDEIANSAAFLLSLLEPPIPLTMKLHSDAVAIARRHKLAFYDGLIVASAASVSCSVLYSEDMQDGQTISGVTIRNPFVHP